jgi:hypothetical protein
MGLFYFIFHCNTRAYLLVMANEWVEQIIYFLISLRLAYYGSAHPAYNPYFSVYFFS